MADTFLVSQKENIEIATFDDATYIQTRDYLETLLANTKDCNAVLEEKLQSQSFYRSICERESEKNKSLLENQAKPKSKLVIKISENEPEANELEGQIEKAKPCVVDHETTTDKEIKIVDRHHKDTLILKNKLKQYQRKIKEKEGEERRIKMILDKEKQSFKLDKSNFKKQVDQLSNRLQHEQEMRIHFEKISQEQSLDIINLKSAEKVYFNERERLEKLLLESERKIEKIKEYYDSHYIPKEKIEEYKRDMETKARLDVNKKLQEVNLHLEEQSFAREAFEKIRIEKDVKTRKDLEDTISQLKMEISSLKSNSFEDLVTRETSEVQVQRFQTLFKDERNFNDKIKDKLKKTSNLLDLERSRTNICFEDSMSKLSKKLFEDSPNKCKHSTTFHGQFSNNSKRSLWSTLMENTYGKSAEREYVALFDRSPF